jgi:hypothetical protein
MPAMTVQAGVKQASIEATIIRCTCAPEAMTHEGLPCPNGRLEELGAVSYYHRNPLKRWIHARKAVPRR